MSKKIFKLNPLIDEIIEKQGLDRSSTWLGIFAAIYLPDDGFNALIDVDMFSQEQEHNLRLHLLNFNYEDGEYEERIPLFVSTEEGDYNDFLARLMDSGMAVDGLSGNKQSYNILEDNEPSRIAFNTLKLRIGESFNFDTLVQVTLDYYRDNERPKKLANYLDEVAIIAYRSFGSSDTFRGAWMYDDE